ncbi:cobalamin adenosyltransferase [Desulforamulus ferrireducens]|uniref:Cobalamin adenosyltransferase n=1 Tax=Desulforamulus ferrireducens TaxID=1833852 RepID=A0A1S6ISF6_9FIRM|nr:cobalamin adenosyltransferase [Desulforamulus ferrireducens]AQS57700.1 cobalamin adenosyltransferase [Desulforamulus ferrireducens]
MKFITEMELRELYKREPFTSYVLEPETKITPGARQFLIDRRVTLVTAPATNQQISANQEEPGANRSDLKLLRKLERVEALFFLTAAELLHSSETDLAEDILALARCFQNVCQAAREQQTPASIEFWQWSEEEIKQRSANLEKHLDISEFHVRLENGKEIALLNYLRASLCELEPAILASYWQEEQQNCSRQDLIDKIYLIINILCMIMWKCLGGRKWKP